MSPIVVAVLLGLMIRNTAGLQAAYDAGLRFCVRRILQTGVALRGIGLGPFAVGVTAALLVGVVSFVMVRLVIGAG